jgi:hypothetical protein
MSHFAEVKNEKVIRVIVAEQDFIDSGAVGDSSNWIQTSYNTRGGIHYAPNTINPDGGVALRKNYAGIGYTYDSDRDAFIAPKPFNSWSLNEDSCMWEAPVPYPDDEKTYEWDESIINWVEIN